MSKNGKVDIRRILHGEEWGSISTIAGAGALRRI
jgi:hypothetical protein